MENIVQNIIESLTNYDTNFYHLIQKIKKNQKIICQLKQKKEKLILFLMKMMKKIQIQMILIIFYLLNILKMKKIILIYHMLFIKKILLLILNHYLQFLLQKLRKFLIFFQFLKQFF